MILIRSLSNFGFFLQALRVTEVGSISETAIWPVFILIHIVSVLKVVRGLATKRYEFSKYNIFKRNKHVCVAQHLYISDILEFF